MNLVYHKFHIVENSPWPLFMGLGVMGVMSSIVYWFKFNNMQIFIMSMFFIVFISLIWWRDVMRESTYQGCHLTCVQMGVKLSMLLFIFSEIMFFSAFFWTFLHSSVTPTMEIGLLWPPVGVSALNPFSVPLLNTVVLLSSGVTVTWSHYNLIMGKYSHGFLLITIILGVYFTLLQYMEYKEAMFSMSDSVYGSIFFMATGFHGIHVLIGTTFLMVMMVRILFKQLVSSHHVGYELSIWYWHFVDVVWLYLFFLVYWWGF